MLCKCMRSLHFSFSAHGRTRDLSFLQIGVDRYCDRNGFPYNQSMSNNNNNNSLSLISAAARKSRILTQALASFDAKWAEIDALAAEQAADAAGPDCYCEEYGAQICCGPECSGLPLSGPAMVAELSASEHYAALDRAMGALDAKRHFRSLHPDMQEYIGDDYAW